jgi:hypothetical protein
LEYSHVALAAAAGIWLVCFRRWFIVIIRVRFQVREFLLYILFILLINPADPQAKSSIAIGAMLTPKPPRASASQELRLRQLKLGERSNGPTLLAIWTMKSIGIKIHEL